MSVLRKGSKPWENQRFYVGYQVTPRDSSRNLLHSPLLVLLWASPFGKAGGHFLGGFPVL